MAQTQDRRAFLRLCAAGAAAALGCTQPPTKVGGDGEPDRLNLLLITADDLNWDSVGCYGATAPEITSHIDRLAREGLRFLHAHVTISICQPARSVLLTGRYPHRSGAEGFQPIRGGVPTLNAALARAGYFQGALSKLDHSTMTGAAWDASHYQGDLGMGRSPEQYHKRTRDFLARAQAARRPFFLMVNVEDPHRPFYGSDQERSHPGIGPRLKETLAPSRVYRPAEVETPGFLPDLPEVRREIAQYTSSVRRCDDAVGATLRALREAGEERRTLVMFLSDNGASLPFAKTNCYRHSTRTPWIVRWPGAVRAGTTDAAHAISAIDFMPTVLEAAGLPAPAGMDGRSFLPLLRGQTQTGRELVFTQLHQTFSRQRFPMRAVQDRRYGYIFNAWADGKRTFENEALSGLTFSAMRRAATNDPAIARRVDFYLHRTLEEFYDYEKDPHALNNLIDDPAHRAEIDRLRGELERWMEKTGDPALEAFRHRHSPAALERFMAAQQAKAAAEYEQYKPR